MAEVCMEDKKNPHHALPDVGSFTPPDEDVPPEPDPPPPPPTPVPATPGIVPPTPAGITGEPDGSKFRETEP